MKDWAGRIHLRWQKPFRDLTAYLGAWSPILAVDERLLWVVSCRSWVTAFDPELPVYGIQVGAGLPRDPGHGHCLSRGHDPIAGQARSHRLIAVRADDPPTQR